MNALQFTERRKELFRSQQAAADALGITQQALSNWETGRQEVPLIVVKFFECLEKAEKAEVCRYCGKYLRCRKCDDDWAS